MKAISVREFMRGGYKKLEEPVVVTKHGKPIGMWIPPFHVETKVDQANSSSR